MDHPQTAPHRPNYVGLAVLVGVLAGVALALYFSRRPAGPPEPASTA